MLPLTWNQPHASAYPATTLDNTQFSIVKSTSRITTVAETKNQPTNNDFVEKFGLGYIIMASLGHLEYSWGQNPT